MKAINFHPVHFHPIKNKDVHGKAVEFLLRS